MTKQSYILSTIITMICLTQYSCGTNSLEALEPDNSAARAALRLEAQEPGAAIEILLSALGADYKELYEGINSSTNLGSLKSSLTTEMYKIKSDGTAKHVFELVSILSSAHAQLHGIDPFDVALALARSDSEEEETSSETVTETTTAVASTGNDVTKLFPILPLATTQNILGLDVAIVILQSLESSNYSESDSYKEAIFLTSSVSLVTKALDLNADGEISLDEVIALQGSGGAASILNQLRAAASVMSSSSGVGNSTDTADGAAKISGILTEIDSQEGSTDEDKLINYLSDNTATSD